MDYIKWNFMVFACDSKPRLLLTLWFRNWQDPFHQEYWPILIASWPPCNALCVETLKCFKQCYSCCCPFLCKNLENFQKKLNAHNKNSKGDYRIITPWLWCRLGQDWSPRVGGETIKVDFFIANPIYSNRAVSIYTNRAVICTLIEHSRKHS